MKLVITGASGFVATEIIRQALQMPKITSIIALARQKVQVPSSTGLDANAQKFQSIVVEDYLHYSDDTKDKLAGANACIWTVAITPSKSKNFEDEYVREVNCDWTMAGLAACFEMRAKTPIPFRFMYVSGLFAERDRNKTPPSLPEYFWQRGDVEKNVLAFAAQHNGQLEACVAKPGMITTPSKTMASNYPRIDLSELSAALLHQIVDGFAKEPLLNDDLVKIGQQALQGNQ